MAIRLATATAIAAANAAVDLVDVSGPGTIEIRTGAAPATCELADSGVLLATLTFSATAFGAAADGTDKATAAAAAITGDASADATGTAAHFRVKDGLGAVIWQGTVGTSGADLNLDTVAINAGDTVDVTSWDYSQPEA